MVAVYTVLATLLHKNIVLHVTNNKKHVINKKNEIIARFLEFHVGGDNKL